MGVEVQYIILFSCLLILPKVILRFRIPSAFTALILGFLCTKFLGWFEADQLILMLARLGITSLFLFAGMEVNVAELKNDSKALSGHLAKILVLIFLVAYGISYGFDINMRGAIILSLGIMTPSTGFILDTLPQYKLNVNQQKWVGSKAISKEIAAIFIMFFVLQSGSLEGFAVSFLAILAMIFILPLFFKYFLKVIAPFAPGSEVSFLILLALVCGVITTKLGAYYLVGAFIVGMTAGRFKHFSLHGGDAKIVQSLEFFFSFFVPFYFFKAGANFPAEVISMEGVLLGLGALVVFLPLRVGVVYLSIWMFLKESWKERKAIALPLLPTLIFGFVIGDNGDNWNTETESSYRKLIDISAFSGTVKAGWGFQDFNSAMENLAETEEFYGYVDIGDNPTDYNIEHIRQLLKNKDDE